jgi:signal transduction histidine kinase
MRNPAKPPQAVQPSALLRSLERMLARLVGERIVLRLDLGEGLGWVSVDAVQLEQAILNLVLNARDALPAGGQIGLTTSRIEVASPSRGALRPGRYAVLRVRDDGTGMNEATRARLFELFFTTKGPGRGSGLGLSLVQRFVSEAGGEIRVSSVLGEGTTVDLLLPEIGAPAAAEIE